MMNKSAKIIVFALSLALLIGAAIGFSASAETTAPEIVSKNVAVDGNFSLVFAVDPATVAGDDVTVTIYNQVPADGVKPLQTITKAKANTTAINLDGDDSNGKEYNAIIFYTEGVSAKDIADVWYITTSSNGVTSEPITYSVREYAFERLYKNGTVFATSDEGYRYEQQQFYLEILDVGSAAQQLLVNYGKAEDQQEKLAKEYIYAAVVGGTYTLGETTLEHGFVSNGDVLTLTSTDESVKAWDVYTFGQHGGQNSVQTVADGDTVTVAGNIAAVPYTMGVTPGKYFDEIGDSIYSFTDGFVSENFVGNSGDYRKFLSHTRYYDAPNYGYKVGNSAIDNHGNTLTVYKSESASQMCLIHFPIVDATEKEANCVVFETDFLYTGADLYYNKSTDTTTGTFYISVNSTAFTDTAGKTWNQLSKTYQGEIQTIDLDGVKTPVDPSSSTTQYKSEKGTNAIRLPGSTINLEANTWYNICLEIYTDVDKYIIYLDGNQISSGNLNDKNLSDYNSVSFLCDYRIKNYEMMYDNVYGGKIVKEYVAP